LTKATEVPFERNNTDAQNRKDRDSKSKGKRRRSSLEKVIDAASSSRIETLFGPGGRELLVPSYLICYASMDLLALAAATGMKGQSACSCCWCRLTPVGFGEWREGALSLVHNRILPRTSTSSWA
jgi:hypothetical protein